MNLFDDFISLIWPRRCPGCDEKLHHKNDVLCIACEMALPETTFHLEKDNPIAQKFWGKVNLQAAMVGYSFKKGARIQEVLHQLKYSGNQKIGIYMGQLIGEKLKSSPLYSDIEIIIPVPLHPKKKRIRGFNQSEVIAIGMAKAMNCKIDTTTICRHVHTATQTKKDRMERWENVSGIFKLSHVDQLNGKHILVVDDVITTGATMEACVKALQDSGIEKISVAAIAAPL